MKQSKTPGVGGSFVRDPDTKKLSPSDAVQPTHAPGDQAKSKPKPKTKSSTDTANKDK